MMKKTITLTLALFSLLSLSTLVQAQEFPPLDKSPMDMAYYPSKVALRAFAKTDEGKNAEPIIRVTYSRPKADGRAVFTELEKPGNMWRVGANEATEVMFFQDVKIDGKKVKAGRYTMYIKLAEENWTVYFSTDTDGWGHYAFDPEASSVAEITVPVEKTEETIENVSIMFEKAEPGAHMLIGWDDRMVRVPVEL